MAQPTALEQLQLELINRARANPNAEAARLGIGLNDGLSGGTISSAPKAPLAFSLTLNDAADAHTADMIQQDYFDHRGLNGSTPATRAFAAGWSSDGFGYSIGENIAWIGSTDASQIFTVARVQSLHDNLFDSSGHRTNILGEGYSEIGLGVGGGSFTDPRTGRTWNGTSMVTQAYADGSRTFLTGVLIDDKDNDDFYDVGEGLGNVTVTATGSAGTYTTVSFGSGGYSLEVPAGSYTITFSGGALGATVTRTATIGDDNVKIDVEKPAGPVVSTINGTPGADTLTGTSGDDTIHAIGGPDTVRAGGGNDLVTGGTGNDLLDGEDGNDRIFGGGDNDTIVGGTGDDLLRGDDGNDRLTGNAGADVLVGGDGSDTMDGGADNDRIYGGNGDDIIFGGPGNDITRGDAGNDRIDGGDGDDIIVGGPGNDILAGDAGNDRIYGVDGDDRLHGGGDDDFLVGGIGSDAIFGDAGNDWLRGGADADLLRGGDGNDDVRGNAGTDTIYGDDGDDRLFGNDGNDVLYGGAGNDRLYGQGDDDVFRAGSGSNVINGGDGYDRADYGGVQSAYTIVTNAAGVTSITGLGVADILIDMELALFSDGSLVL